MAHLAGPAWGGLRSPELLQMEQSVLHAGVGEGARGENTGKAGGLGLKVTGWRASGEVTVQGRSVDIADGPCEVSGQGEVYPGGLVCGLYAPNHDT